MTPCAPRDCQAVLVDVGALAKAVLGDGEDEALGDAELLVEGLQGLLGVIDVPFRRAFPQPSASRRPAIRCGGLRVPSVRHSRRRRTWLSDRRASR